MMNMDSNNETGGRSSGEEGGDGARTRRREWRWMTVLLVVSLGLNIFVVGWAGARFASHAGLWHWSRDHDHGRRGELAEILREHRGVFGELGYDAGENLRGVADALRADPFDPAAFASSIDLLEDNAHGLVRLGGGAAKEVAGKLEDGERQWAARRLERAARKLERWSQRRNDY